MVEKSQKKSSVTHENDMKLKVQRQEIVLLEHSQAHVFT